MNDHEHVIGTYWSETYRRNNAIKPKHSKYNMCQCGAIYALERWYVIENPTVRKEYLQAALRRKAKEAGSA